MPDRALAVLLHGGAVAWRRELRAALLSRARRNGAETSSLVVLLSWQEAEAAKWLADPRLVLVVTADDAQMRKTVAAVAPAVAVRWIPRTADLPPTLALVEEILQRLRQQGAVVP